MTQDLVPDSIEARARRRVRRKLGFYTHALVYALVNLGLWLFDALAGRPPHTHMLFAWGAGLAIHGVVTLVSLQAEGLRERMIREEIERMRRDRR